MMRKLPLTHRVRRENEMIRKREKEFQHDQLWTGTEKYFKHWEKVNTKFDNWTSPRYYEDNNKLVHDIKNKRDAEDQLRKRKEKLRKLLQEEEKSYEIELFVNKSKNVPPPNNSDIDLTTEILRELNLGLKLEEENRRRHDAEIKLYHKWRNNNPTVKYYERSSGVRNMKLSWLDQQIEKRMRKEKEEEECKKILKERDERLRKQAQKDEELKKELEEKNSKLKHQLDLQIAELKRKQEESNVLKQKESEEMKKKIILSEIEEKHLLEEKRRVDREYALFNIKQHKQKLKQKIKNIQQTLLEEKELILKLQTLQLQDILEDETKRREIQEGLKEFLKVVKEQQELEKHREKYFQFIFDSEAKSIYEDQTEVWSYEEASRNNLLKDVINTIKQQIDLNLNRNKQQQQEILKEREQLTELVEEIHKEMEEISNMEAKNKLQKKNFIDEDLKLKECLKFKEQNCRFKEINNELERVRKEEERLKQEILNIQRRQGPVRPSRSRILF